jgi:hypothetical protein
MEDCAGRGVFRGFSRGPVSGSRLRSDGRRQKEVHTDPGGIAVRAGQPRDSRAFVRGHEAAGLPDHRRIEKTKARLRRAKCRGNASVAMEVEDGDYGYALQRLLHRIPEIFAIFLLNGKYRDCAVAQLGGDPDRDPKRSHAPFIPV